VELLFLMLPIFSEHSLVNYGFLKAFYLEEVAVTYEPKHKAAIVRHFLTLFSKPTCPTEDNVHALQLLVLPLLTEAFKRGEAGEMLATDIINAVITSLLGGEHLPNYDEALRIELLKLATLLIEHASDHLVEHRKELIKFAWNHLKSDDTQSKQCAYVNVCRFIQVYDTPPKIILQVYVALLRTFQPDARTLVKQALDILTPALPKRLPPLLCPIACPRWRRALRLRGLRGLRARAALRELRQRREVLGVPAGEAARGRRRRRHLSRPSHPRALFARSKHRDRSHRRPPCVHGRRWLA
jgi:transformation/transcription domain-associated protein